ncbi:hypothetical protein VCHA30O60_200058 [Vibrio chagasii]|nr:hypothetical protein VCHA30O60_200058 [Vibrio chagasii]
MQSNYFNKELFGVNLTITIGELSRMKKKPHKAVWSECV